MRHLSKVFVEIPDGPPARPEAVVRIECDVCGPSVLHIHLAHVGTVLRCLGDSYLQIAEDDPRWLAMGVAETPTEQRRLRDRLERFFPGWKAGRLKE